MLLSKSSLKTYTLVVTNASMSRAAALQLELAVGMAIYLEVGGRMRLVKETLLAVYLAAGYKCENAEDIDWRVIQRRISATLALIEFLGHDEISAWGKELTKKPLIDAIVEKLEPLKLKTINEVLLVCEKIKQKAQPKPREHHDVPGSQRIQTEHLQISIAPDVTREELIDTAMLLMKLANEMGAKTLTPREVEKQAALAA